MRTARAALAARASSAVLSTGHETTWKVMEARKASMKLWDAVEPSKSCTTIGSSFTVSEIAELTSRIRTRGRTSARVSVRQSRTIWVSSFRDCATIRLMLAPSYFSMDTLPCRRAFSTMEMKTSSSEKRSSRALITWRPFSSSRLVVWRMAVSGASSVMT